MNNKLTYPYSLIDENLPKVSDQSVSGNALTDLWHGRKDSLEGDLAKRWHETIKVGATKLSKGSTRQKVDLLGFACDIGVNRNQGRIGAQLGPDAIRQKLCNLPIDINKIDLTDLGNVIAESTHLEACQQSFANHIEKSLNQGAFPIGLGGGHEIAYASFSGLANHLATKHTDSKVANIGIINFDAHFDLRFDERPSSGTPFFQIAKQCEARQIPFHYCCLGVSQFANTKALFKRANDLGVTYLTDEQMSAENKTEIKQVVDTFVKKVDVIYMTVCLDVFPASIVPGVSAPAAGGVSLLLVEQVISWIIASNKLVLFDIAEMNPNYDIDGHTASIAARLIAKTIQKKMEN